MNASTLYKDLIKDISLSLGKEGFSRKGDTFYFNRNGNWGLVDFQKSRKSTQEEVIFTVNLGICSTSLLKFFRPELTKALPSLEDCQWCERLGFLLPQRQDTWWTIKNQNSSILVDELKYNLANLAIPKIHQYIEDSQLCQEWLSGKSPGLTNIQRLLSLSVLLKIINKKEALNQTLKELEAQSFGKPVAFTVKQHVQKLKDMSDTI